MDLNKNKQYHEGAMMINEPSNLKLDLSAVKDRSAEMHLHQTLDLDQTQINSVATLPQSLTRDKFVKHVK